MDETLYGILKGQDMQVTTLPSFNLQFSLGFVTSCYVIMDISIA